MKEDKVEKILSRIPEKYRNLPHVETVIRRFIDEKQYVELNEYNGAVGFIVGLLHALGLADILVVGHKIYFKLRIPE